MRRLPRSPAWQACGARFTTKAACTRRSLQDPKPKVSAILSACGKPETTDVKWLQFQPNTQGKALRSEEVLDRTADPSKPIYLTSTAKGGAQGAGWQGKDAAKDFKADGQGSGGPATKPFVAASDKGVKAEKASGATGRADDDAEGMQDDADAEVGGESGRTATTDE